MRAKLQTAWVAVLFAGVACGRSAQPRATEKPLAETEPAATSEPPDAAPVIAAATDAGAAEPGSDRLDADVLGTDGIVYIAGTRIPDTPENLEVIDVMEFYRQALENFDVQALEAMIHPAYSDARSGQIVNRDQQVRSIRAMAGRVRVKYVSFDYRGIHWRADDRVEVDVNQDASYELAGTTRQLRDSVRIALERHEGQWMFTSGM